MKVEIGQTYVDCDRQCWRVIAIGPDESWDTPADFVTLMLMVDDAVRTRRTLAANLLDPEMYRLVPKDKGYTPSWFPKQLG